MGLIAATIPVALLAWNGAAKIRFQETTDTRPRCACGTTPASSTAPTPTSCACSLRAAPRWAVGDFDGDGRDDMFVTDSDKGKRSFLYRNNGDGTFTEMAEKAGVAGGNDPLSIVARCALVRLRQRRPPGSAGASLRHAPCSITTRGNGKFKNVSATSGFNKFGNTIAVIAFDYDRDGKLDVMFGDYFKPVNLLDLKTHSVLPNDLDNAVNGGGVSLWHNEGNGRFTNVTEKAGFAKHTGWTLDLGHGDLNNDGWQDVYLACDYGTDRMYLNNGDGHVSRGHREGPGLRYAQGHERRNRRLRQRRLARRLRHQHHRRVHEGMQYVVAQQPRRHLHRHLEGNQHLRHPVGLGRQIRRLDNDGWLDLFVVNGPSLRQQGQLHPVLLPLITTPGVDFTDVRLWPKIGEMTWSGYQKKKMFRNMAGQTFKEISAEAGTDNDKDGRGLGIADFDNDGKLDIYQTNADPGLHSLPQHQRRDGQLGAIPLNRNQG